jgi:signal transduction histidine kinase
MTPVSLDFDAAITAHAEWKLKLCMYTHGEGDLDHRVICRDDRCVLGRWIHTEGTRFANEEVYEHLRDAHARFHRAASDVVKRVDEGHAVEARGLIGPGSTYDGLSCEVIAAISALKRRVEDKTQLIMSGLPMGILLIDAESFVQSGYSKHCHDLLGPYRLAGRRLADVLRASPADRARIETALEQLFDDVLPDEVSLAMLPRRLPVGSRLVGLQASVLRETGHIAWVLVTLTDDTEVARLEAETAELHALTRILKNRESFLRFLAETREALATAGLVDQAHARRVVHTLKGGAGLFEMTEVVAVAQRIEDGPSIGPDHVAALGAVVRGFVERHADALGTSWDRATDELHHIDEVELGRFERRLPSSGGTEPADVVAKELVSRLRMRTIRALIGPIEDRVGVLAGRLGKSLRCEVSGDDTLVVPAKVSPLLFTLSHCLRNAVDHGIEDPETRVSAGKAEEGSLQIAFEHAGEGGLRIHIRDDGRGIDGARLVEKAVAKGVLAASDAEKLSEDERLRLVFADGLSTADTVSEISGRGVGMGAMAEAARSLGGDLHLRSQRGQGTTLEIWLPAA